MSAVAIELRGGRKHYGFPPAGGRGGGESSGPVRQGSRARRSQWRRQVDAPADSCGSSNADGRRPPCRRGAGAGIHARTLTAPAVSADAYVREHARLRGLGYEEDEAEISELATGLQAQHHLHGSPTADSRWGTAG